MYIATIKEKRGYKFESCQRWVHEKVRREEMEEKMIKLYYNLQNNLKIMCVYICVYVCPRNPEKNVGLLGSSRAGAGVTSCDRSCPKIQTGLELHYISQADLKCKLWKFWN